MIDDLPPLPASLRPQPGRIEHLPRELKFDGSGARALPPGLCSSKQQEGLGNPSYRQDHRIWLLSMKPLAVACDMVVRWIDRGLVQDPVDLKELTALLDLRLESEERKTR